MERPRHTIRTDPPASPAKQVTFRVDPDVLDRVDAAIARGIPDVRNRSDAIQDSLWLWLYAEEK